MKQQLRYYVSRKNFFVWLAVLMSLGSVALQILPLYFGEKISVSTVGFWFHKVLPIAISLGFAVLLLFCGRRCFYRSTTVFFWGCVYFGYVALDLHNNGGCWIIYLVLYMIYRWVLTGKLSYTWLLSVVTLLPLCVLIYDLAIEYKLINLAQKMVKFSDVLMVGAIFIATLAVRRFHDGVYHKTWGDRSDGRRLRTIDGMAAVGNYFMPNRNGASNSIHDSIEISNLERYIHKKRAEGMKNFGITHVFLAGYVRCVAKYPGLNRFLSGQRVYQRDNDIQFTMAIKKDMRTDGEETMIKLHLTPEDTTKEIYEKFNTVCEEVKSTPLDSSFDSVAGILANIPGLLMKFIFWILKVLDYFGKLPKFLLEVSPFHASVIFTSMGSLGIPPIIHHLYDFGNIPVFVAFGRKYRKTELDSQGNPVVRRYVDFVMNCDERTVDGFYYATVLKYFHKLMRNPEVLDQPPTQVVRDID